LYNSYLRFDNPIIIIIDAAVSRTLPNTERLPAKDLDQIKVRAAKILSHKKLNNLKGIFQDYFKTSRITGLNKSILGII
jgi:hypothetical protein